MRMPRGPVGSISVAHQRRLMWGQGRDGRHRRLLDGALVGDFGRSRIDVTSRRVGIDLPSLARASNHVMLATMKPGDRQVVTDDAAWSALMVRAQQGDKSAYHQLLTKITPFVRALGARYARSQEDLEDTVQDVLLTLHSIRHTYEGDRPFLPWLATIAVRRAIDRVRVRGRHVAHEVALHPDHETFIGAEPKNELAGLEAEELRRAVERLPAGQRQAITLLKLRELSLEEAATITGLSVAALKVATHRALKSLKLMILKA